MTARHVYAINVLGRITPTLLQTRCANTLGPRDIIRRARKLRFRLMIHLQAKERLNRRSCTLLNSPFDGDTAQRRTSTVEAAGECLKLTEITGRKLLPGTLFCSRPRSRKSATCIIVSKQSAPVRRAYIRTE